MSTATFNSCFLSSLSPSKTSVKRSSPSTLRPFVFANLNNSSSSANISSNNTALPRLIRNEPVLATPAPIITPTLSGNMSTESYEAAIAGLKKLLRYMVGVEGNMVDLDLEMTRAVKWFPRGFNYWLGRTSFRFQ